MSLENVVKRENDAVYVNNNVGGYPDIHITNHGSDVYYAICALMTFSTIVFIALAMMKPRSHRLFHYITAAVTMTAAIAYFTMGSNLGQVPIVAEFQRPYDPKVRGITREIFYARYIDWFITTPLLLMDLLLTAGLPWPYILWVIFVDWVMIVTGLIGALTRTVYKWGYYAFGCAALFYILYVLVWEGRRHAYLLGNDVGRVFFMCGTLTAVIWLLYPIAWAVDEGANLIAPDSEAVFYGVLDAIAKPVFGALLIWGHRNIEPSRLGLDIKEYAEDPSYRSGHREKHGAPGPDPRTNGHTNGVTGGPHDTVTGTAPPLNV